MLFVVICIIIIIVCVFVGISQFYDAKDELKKSQEKEARRLEQRKAEEDNVAHIKQILSDKYGQPSKIININKWKEFDVKKYIIIFAEPSIVFLDGQEMTFDGISSFKIIDNYQVKHGEVIGELDTKTNTGSLIGRSVGGAVLGGGVGAVIGASSASKNTSAHYLQKNDQLIHDYILIVGTKCFDKPTIQIRIGDNWKVASEIEIVFNLILEKNKK